MVGAQRTRGTSMLIEDVACPVENLADMSCDLIDMFERHGYEASVFGHAMEGNMHLVFSQGFRDERDIKIFADMMQELCEIANRQRHFDPELARWLKSRRVSLRKWYHQGDIVVTRWSL